SDKESRSQNSDEEYSPFEEQPKAVPPGPGSLFRPPLKGRRLKFDSVGAYVKKNPYKGPP
ncbi:MAG TPA: hypothetical protein DDW42_01100, partial [Desulfobacteraceae bacterium]|nr:hypothetical protein [Desulfobacteraceae bacterium]